MPSRNNNFIILPKSWSGHGRTDRTGSAGPEIPSKYAPSLRVSKRNGLENALNKHHVSVLVAQRLSVSVAAGAGMDGRVESVMTQVTHQRSRSATATQKLMSISRNSSSIIVNLHIINICFPKSWGNKTHYVEVGDTCSPVHPIIDPHDFQYSLYRTIGPKLNRLGLYGYSTKQIGLYSRSQNFELKGKGRESRAKA